MWPTMAYKVYLVFLVIICSDIVVSTPYNEKVARQRGYYVDRPLNQQVPTYENQNYARPQNVGTVGSMYQNPYNLQPTQYRRSPNDEILRMTPAPAIQKTFETPPWVRVPDKRFEYQNYYQNNGQNTFRPFPQNNLPSFEQNRQYVPQVGPQFGQNPAIEPNRNFGPLIQRNENPRVQNVEPLVHNRQQLLQVPPFRPYYTDVGNREINREWLPNGRVDVRDQTQNLNNNPALVSNKSGIPNNPPLRQNEGNTYTPTQKSVQNNYYPQDIPPANQRPELRNVLPNGTILNQLAGNHNLRKYMIVYRNGSVEYVDNLDSVRDKSKTILKIKAKEAVAQERVPAKDNGQQSSYFIPTRVDQSQITSSSIAENIKLNNPLTMVSNPIVNVQSMSQYSPQNNPQMVQQLPIQPQNMDSFKKDVGTNTQTISGIHQETMSEPNKNSNRLVAPVLQDSQVSIPNLKIENQNLNKPKEVDGLPKIIQDTLKDRDFSRDVIMESRYVNEFKSSTPPNITPPIYQDLQKQNLNVQPIEPVLLQRENVDTPRRIDDTNRQVVSETQTPVPGNIIEPKRITTEFILLSTKNNQPLIEDIIISRGQNMNVLIKDAVNRPIDSEVHIPVQETLEPSRNLNEFTTTSKQVNQPTIGDTTGEEQTAKIFKQEVLTTTGQKVPEMPDPVRVANLEPKNDFNVFVAPTQDNGPVENIARPDSNVNLYQTETETHVNKQEIPNPQNPVQYDVLESNRDFSEFILPSTQDGNVYVYNKDINIPIDVQTVPKQEISSKEVIIEPNIDGIISTSTTSEKPFEIAVIPINYVTESNDNIKINTEKNVASDKLEIAPADAMVQSALTTEKLNDGNQLFTNDEPYQQPLYEPTTEKVDSLSTSTNSYYSKNQVTSTPLPLLTVDSYQETTEPWFLETEGYTTNRVTEKGNLSNENVDSVQQTTIKSDIRPRNKEIKDKQSKNETEVVNVAETPYDDELLSGEVFSEEIEDENSNSNNTVTNNINQKIQNGTQESILEPFNSLLQNIYEDFKSVGQKQNSSIPAGNNAKTNKTESKISTKYGNTTTNVFIAETTDPSSDIDLSESDESFDKPSLSTTKGAEALSNIDNGTNINDDSYKYMDVESLFREYNSEHPDGEASNVSAEDDDDAIPNPFTEYTGLKKSPKRKRVKSFKENPSLSSEEERSGSDEYDYAKATNTKNEGAKMITTRIKPDALRKMFEGSTLNDSGYPDNKTIVFKVDANFWEKLKSGDLSYDVVYLFQVPNQPIVEKETHTIIYPNGTIVQQYVEKTWNRQDTEPVIQSKSRLTHPDGTIVEDPYIPHL